MFTYFSNFAEAMYLRFLFLNKRKSYKFQVLQNLDSAMLTNYQDHIFLPKLPRWEEVMSGTDSLVIWGPHTFGARRFRACFHQFIIPMAKIFISHCLSHVFPPHLNGNNTLQGTRMCSLSWTLLVSCPACHTSLNDSQVRGSQAFIWGYKIVFLLVCLRHLSLHMPFKIKRSQHFGSNHKAAS